MNWSRGLRRTAILFTVAYWLIACLAAGARGVEAYRSAKFDVFQTIDGPWMNYWPQHAVVVKGQVYRVLARNASEARTEAEKLSRASHPLYAPKAAAWAFLKSITAPIAAFMGLGVMAGCLLWAARGFAQPSKH